MELWFHLSSILLDDNNSLVFGIFRTSPVLGRDTSNVFKIKLLSGNERKRDERQFKDGKLRSHSRSPTRRHFHDERTERKKERYRSPNRYVLRIFFYDVLN